MKIIAHRCGTDRYPELTVAAARHSLAAGAAYVEMDVRFTADGVPVIHHDDTAAGLFGDPRRIAEMTLPEFLALRRQSDPAFCSHTMEDFLRCGVRQILYHVKQGGARLQPLLDLCRRYGCEEQIALGLTSAEDIRYAREHSGAAILAFLPAPERIAEFAAAGADAIRLWESWLTPETIRAVRQTGKELWIMAKAPGQAVGYTAPETLLFWRDEWGADGVLLNEVRPALALLHA